MKLTEQLKASIKEDIVICESYPQRNGSEALYGQMVAKYSMLDEGFAKNLSTNGKITSLDREYDYRPELKAIAAKLHMRLMLDNSDTAKEEKDRVMPATVTSPQVFISHRSTDKAIAEMLVDFLIGTGIPITYIFCSSLPGNDVKEKIPQEVKDAIKKSVVNIAILSHEYYRSAYCLNEAGIFWFLSAITTIPIALPEISSNSMYGFLDDDYKIRRLDNENDISYIYDTVRQATAISQEKSEYITTQISKLKSRYLEIIKNRPAIKPQKAESVVESITTDDEAVILYFILSKKVRKIKKSDVLAWLNAGEIHDINVDNAFDLLSAIGNGEVKDDVLEIDIDTFRRHIENSEDILCKSAPFVEKHRLLSKNMFESMWLSGKFDEIAKLFIAYIIDEQVTSFGDRWMADKQTEHIINWENKNMLGSTLSNKYGSCLSMFIEHRLVYESSWTSYGNPREYTLCTSLKKYLFDRDFPYANELTETMQHAQAEYMDSLPF